MGSDFAERRFDVTKHAATGICQTDTAVCLLSVASRKQYLFDKCLLLYAQS